MKNLIPLSLVLIITLSNLARAHGPIPVPLEGVIKLIDRQLPKKIDPVDKNLSDFPPIADDLDDLDSKDKNIYLKAFQRLQARGNAVIPEFTHQLSNPDLNLSKKKRLSYILSRLKIPGTEKIIIDFTEELRNLDDETRKLNLKILYYQTFRSLSGYDDISASINYANTLLDNKKINPVIHAQALEFLANEKVKSATAWIDIYKDNNNIDIQYAALYLGGRLSNESTTEETITFLKNMPKSKESYKREVHLLLSNLVRFINPEEILDLIKTIKKNDGRFIADEKLNAYPILSMLYTGNNEQRTKAAQASLTLWSSNKEAVIESLEHMVEGRDATPYITLWKLHHPILRRYLHHMGYAIKVNENTAEFIKSSNDDIIKMPDSELLAQSLLDSFINNDIDLFKSSIMMNKNILKLTRQNRSGSNDDKKMDSYYNSVITHALSEWKSIYKKGEATDFNWGDVKFLSSKSDVFVNIDGSLISTITVLFEENNQQHTLLLEQCFLFDNHWYSFGSIKLNTML